MSEFKLILLDQLSCANCYALQHALQPLCEVRGIKFELITDEAVDDSFVEKYDVVSYPTGLLFYNDEFLGKFKGYQPNEILEYWLDIKMKERGKK